MKHNCINRALVVIRISDHHFGGSYIGLLAGIIIAIQEQKFVYKIYFSRVIYGSMREIFHFIRFLY